MATRTLNRIVATVTMSSAAFSLTPKPAFADSAHHPTSSGSTSFDAFEKMKTMGYFSHFTKIDDASAMNDKKMDEIECGSRFTRFFKLIYKDYKCKTLCYSLSELNKANCGTFPIEKGKGELLENVLKDEKYEVVKARNSEVWYKDVKEGEGATATDDKILQLRIHCILYDDSEKTVYNSSNHTKSPVEVHLCKHIFGSGFVKGIDGMRVGGIRRIIIPKDFAPKSSEIKAYGVMDVELFAVCASPECCIKPEYL